MGTQGAPPTETLGTVSSETSRLLPTQEGVLGWWPEERLVPPTLGAATCSQDRERLAGPRSGLASMLRGPNAQPRPR